MRMKSVLTVLVIFLFCLSSTGQSVAQDLKADVIVVGGGGSGLTAALAAAEGGAKVIVFEAKAITGGTTNFPMGLFAAESKLQKEKNITFTRDEAFNMMMEYNHYRGNARLIRAFIDKSAGTIEWLEKQGVEFSDASTPVPGAPRTWHLIKGRGGALVKTLTAKAKEKGVDIRLNAPVKKILKEGNRITGVIVEENGKQIPVKANAVIVATGGYGGNKEWVKKYAGFEIGVDMFPRVDVGLMGDGLQMAWDAGAAEEGMGLVEMEYWLSGPGLEGTQLLILVRQPYLWVSLEGQRFGNEETMVINSPFAGNAIARQKSRQSFLIFDEETKKYMETTGFDRGASNVGGVAGDKLANLEAQIKSATEKGNKNLFVANSLEDLASKTGIKIGELKATINEYNGFAEKKKDELFAKNPKYVRPVRVAPFYALRIHPTMLGTLGGIRVNEKLETLSKDYSVVSGLYAVGNNAAGMYGDTYSFAIPGASLGFAINSGRIAGENAAKYSKK
jgi:fumarate reductase flavoprotein subunit